MKRLLSLIICLCSSVFSFSQLNLSKAEKALATIKMEYLYKPDHLVSLDPADFRRVIRMEIVERMMGDSTAYFLSMDTFSVLDGRMEILLGTDEQSMKKSLDSLGELLQDEDASRYTISIVGGEAVIEVHNKPHYNRFYNHLDFRSDAFHGNVRFTRDNFNQLSKKLK